MKYAKLWIIILINLYFHFPVPSAAITNKLTLKTKRIQNTEINNATLAAVPIRSILQSSEVNSTLRSDRHRSVKESPMNQPKDMC